MKEWILPLILWLTLISGTITGIISIFLSRGRYIATTSFFLLASFFHLVNDIYFDWSHTSLIFIAIGLKVIGGIVFFRESEAETKRIEKEEKSNNEMSKGRIENYKDMTKEECKKTYEEFRQDPYDRYR